MPTTDAPSVSTGAPEEQWAMRVLRHARAARQAEHDVQNFLRQLHGLLMLIGGHHSTHPAARVAELLRQVQALLP